ncbi:MAG: hypothetical protein OXP11_18550, partial [Gammaproteobacteria bacterium]|nr:hypothetical protein [Gammaproteobacteria bacterium]
MSIRNQLLLPARRLRNVAFRFSLVLLTVVPLVALASERGQGAAAGIKIPFQKFVLDNGLTLIVHEDRKAPVVAVNVWYHVG